MKVLQESMVTVNPAVKDYVKSFRPPSDKASRSGKTSEPSILPEGPFVEEFPPSE